MGAPETGRQLDRTLAALADPARRAVVDLLRHEPRRAGELAEELALSAPRMSQHLRVLRECGLIEPQADTREDARARSYRLCREPFTALRGWVDDVEQFWAAELGAFKAHAERKAQAERKRGRRASRTT